jgi:copper homeostasis protein
MKRVVEVCVDRMDSVLACAEAGVDRIELCAALSEGGLTPSLGFLKAAREIFPGEIMMMIRPRAGDFLYSALEVEMMCMDILVGLEHGADGFVFGCLRRDGEIDEEVTARLLEAATLKPITFHRAFDVTRDLSRSLEVLVRLGVPRVLTSGGESDVWKGLGRLRELQEQAAGRIVILPGGGVVCERVGELVKATGVSEVHLSARKTMRSEMDFLREDIPMGARCVVAEMEHRVADGELLRRLCRELGGAPGDDVKVG